MRCCYINQSKTTKSYIRELAKVQINKPKLPPFFDWELAWKIASIVFAIIFILLIIVSIPILSSFLFTEPGNDYIKYNMDNNWVGFVGGYMSAVIGGLISGGLTLWGVQLTIKHSNNLLKNEEHERFLESLPARIAIADEIIFFLGKKYNDYKNDEYKNEAQAVKKVNTLYYELRDNYLMKSIKVNFKTYRVIKYMYGEIFDFLEDNVESKDIDNFSILNGKLFTPEFLDDYKQLLKDTITSIEHIKKELENEILKENTYNNQS